MKKIVVLAGIAAAAWGAMKLFRSKDVEAEFGPVDTYQSLQPEA